jgi:hypothetical protein
MARHRSTESRALPSLLVRLIQAARDSNNQSGATAPRELGALALRTIPTHGVFVANDEEVCPILDRVAKDHLGLETARSEFRKAIRVMERFEIRDRIESSHNRFRARLTKATSTPAWRSA